MVSTAQSTAYVPSLSEETYSPSLCEESYDELQMLMREMMHDSGNEPVAVGRINIASGDDLFNEYGENLYARMS